MPVKPLHHLLLRLARSDRPGPASDRALLAAYAAGRDEAAFAELVRRHGAMERGRELLRARLERRGCCLAVGLTAAALAESPEAPAAEWVGRVTDLAAGRAAAPEAVARLAALATPAVAVGRWAAAAVALFGL